MHSPASSIPESDLPIYLQKEKWSRRGAVVAKRTQQIGHFCNLPYILWGPKSTDTCPTTFTNTCTVDNTFMALLYLYNKYLDVRTFIDSAANVRIEQVRHVIALLNSEGGPKANAARYYWVRSVLGDSIDATGCAYNLWGEEHVKSLEPLVDMSSDYLVDQRCVKDNFSSHSTLRVFGSIHGTVEDAVIHINHGGFTMTRCPTCYNATQPFFKKPARALPFLIFGVGAPLSVNKMPRKITVLGDGYELVACSVHENSHWRLVFIVQNVLYEYDGKENTTIIKFNPKKGNPLVSMCYYVKASHPISQPA